MPRFPVLDILSSALLVISEQGGFVNLTQSVQTGKETTANQVVELLRDGSRYAEIKKYIANAKQIKLWFSCKDAVPENTDPNYWQKLKHYVSEMESDKVGLIASSVSFYNQKFTSDKFKEIIKGSKYIGELNTTENCFIKLIYKNHKMDQQRNYYIYKGVTRDGDLVLFYDKNDYPITIGDCFLFRGNIKDHEICNFDNVPVTKF